VEKQDEKEEEGEGREKRKHVEQQEDNSL